MLIYLNDEYIESKEMAHKIASHIKYTSLGHIRKSIICCYDPYPNAKGGYMEQDNVKNVYYSHPQSKMGCQTDINNLVWLIRVELDREKMMDKEVTLLEIKSKFCNAWEKRYADIKNIKKEEKKIIDNITQCAILSNSDNDTYPVLHIRLNMEEHDRNILNDFIEYMIDRFKLKGISGINDIDSIANEDMIVFNNENHEKEIKKHHVIYTSGVNMIDIRYLNGIDVNKTTCNDVVLIYELFGIEAARAVLIRELHYAYEKAGTIVPNYQHISSLVDIMTMNGYLTSIDRFGIGKSDIEPLTKASFEKTVDQLTIAAVYGESDNMKGVSSRIMAGLVIKSGTGLPNIVFDTDMLEKSEYVEDDKVKYDKSYVPINENELMNVGNIDNDETTGIFIPI